MISQAEIPDFQAGQTAQAAHSALRKSLDVAERAQHCVLLLSGEIMRRGLFRELEYSSISSFATEELGFSVGKTRDFVRLAGKLEELPLLKDSVASGRVGYTKAREMIKVATPRTEKDWVEEAVGSTRKVMAATGIPARGSAAPTPASWRSITSGPYRRAVATSRAI